MIRARLWFAGAARTFLGSALLGAALLGAGLETGVATAQDAGAVRIRGSNTVGAELMPALVNGYALEQGLSLVREQGGDLEREAMGGFLGVEPVFRVELERKGSSTGFEALRVGEADIGMASRPIRPTESAALAAAGAPDMRASDSEHVIALDGLAVIVAPSNPLAALSMAQLAAVFSGEIADWSALGQPAGPIALHALADGSGPFDGFETLVLDPADARLAAGAARYFSNDQLVQAVMADPRAIGFVPLAFVGRARAVEISLSCGVLIGPDKFTVKTEEYPLSLRLFLYTRGAPKPAEARRMLAFAVSDAAQPIVSGVGFVDQSIQAQTTVGLSDRLVTGMMAATTDQTRDAMRRFVARTKGATRLSPTFRFTQGGDLLDAKALDDASRLARWLEAPENAGKRILLAGFADTSGAFDKNLALTQKRAEAVRRAVLVQVSPGFDAGRIETEGFGPAAPIACDGDAGGAAANRRVEVWVSP